jgi:type II secretory pathway pseudopilin PulG
MLELVVVLAIIGILASLLLSAVNDARLRARATDCNHRMREVGLAISIFHDALRHYPSNGAYIPGSGLRLTNGRLLVPGTHDLETGEDWEWGAPDSMESSSGQSGSWAYAILPQLNQSLEPTEESVAIPQPMFSCPVRMRHQRIPPLDDSHGNYRSGGIGWAKGDFVVNGYVIKNGFTWAKQRELIDGLSHTLLIGEKAFDRSVQKTTSWYWDEPILIGGSQGTLRTGKFLIVDGNGIQYKDLWGAAHRGSAGMLLADNSVVTISPHADSHVFRALLIPDDGNADAPWD